MSGQDPDRLRESGRPVTGFTRGRVLKGIGGFYYIGSGDRLIRARGKGTFKKEGLLLKVGDEVTLEEHGEDDALIREILPRRNDFSRPPIANVDLLIVVLAVRKPKPNLVVIDKMLAAAEKRGVQPVVLLNKCDLGTPEEAAEIRDVYEPLYPFIQLTATDQEGEDSGITKLRTLIRGRSAALAGQSGVGKSTITNALLQGQAMETGHVSAKTERGRHTTRHVEIFPCAGGFLFDTPGFTSLDLDECGEEEIAGFFPEFREKAAACRFDNCRHLNEPDCGVRAALKAGKIAASRYASYEAMIREARERKKY